MFEDGDALATQVHAVLGRLDDLGALPAASVVRPPVRAVLDLPPGPAQLAGLSALVRCDLTRRESREVAVGFDAVVAHATAGKLLALADLHRATAGGEVRSGRRSRRDPLRAVADEVAAALHLSGPAATRLVARAVRVDATLPAAADALADGRMTAAQLEVLDQTVRDLTPAARARVEALAVRLAPTTTRAQLADRLGEESVVADPEHAARRMAEGVANRDVRLGRSPEPGCRRLVADLPLHDAVALWQVVNGVAVAAKDGGHSDERTLPQLRADALATMVTGWQHERLLRPGVERPAADAPGPVRIPSPAERTAMAEVHVVVSADDLPGSGPSGPGDGPGHGPDDEAPPGAPERAAPFGHVPGHGRLDPTTTAAALLEAPWRRMVVHPASGQLVERSLRRHRPPPGAGPTLRDRLRDRLVVLFTEPRGGPPEPEDHYRPSSALAAHVRARDATCVGSACSRPARTAGVQLDHASPYRHGGPSGQTHAAGMAPLCRRDHQAKTHGGWTLTRPTPTTIAWTSPLGATHVRAVRPLFPGWRPR